MTVPAIAESEAPASAKLRAWRDRVARALFVRMPRTLDAAAAAAADDDNAIRLLFVDSSACETRAAWQADDERQQVRPRLCEVGREVKVTLRCVGKRREPSGRQLVRADLRHRGTRPVPRKREAGERDESVVEERTVDERLQRPVVEEHVAQV